MSESNLNSLMHETIMKMFYESCRILIEEKIDDHEFEYCKNTIVHALTYLQSIRKNKCSQQEKILRE